MTKLQRGILAIPIVVPVCLVPLLNLLGIPFAWGWIWVFTPSVIIVESILNFYFSFRKENPKTLFPAYNQWRGTEEDKLGKIIALF